MFQLVFRGKRVFRFSWDLYPLGVFDVDIWQGEDTWYIWLSWSHCTPICKLHMITQRPMFAQCQMFPLKKFSQQRLWGHVSCASTCAGDLIEKTMEGPKSHLSRKTGTYRGYNLQPHLELVTGPIYLYLHDENSQKEKTSWNHQVGIKGDSQKT